MLMTNLPIESGARYIVFEKYVGKELVSEFVLVEAFQNCVVLKQDKVKNCIVVTMDDFLRDFDKKITK